MIHIDVPLPDVKRSAAATGSEIRVGYLMASLSRRGGGIFDVARRLGQSLSAHGVSGRAFGLVDEQSAADAAGWGCVRPHVFAPLPVLPQFGFAPGLLTALIDADLQLVHAHGLWMYPSLANRRWSKRTGRPYLISPHGMLDPWALRNSRWRKRLARLLYENAHLRR